MPDPFLSELKFLGAGNVDFIEVAVDAGEDVSGLEIIIYNPNGTVRTTNVLENVADSTNAGRDVYSFNSGSSSTFNGVHKNGAVALVQDGVVLQFVSFESTVTATEGPADGLSSNALGATGSGESFESTDGGASYEVNDAPSAGTIPCFVADTLIYTPQGNRKVQEIKAGDQVMTDQGARQVTWVGQRRLNMLEAGEDAKRPICIPAHAFGQGVPFQDVFVSPNHRVLLTGATCQMLFGTAQVFVAAKFLLGYLGVDYAPLGMRVQYHHLLLEDHAVLTANGMPAESLFHGAISAEGFEQDKEAGAVYALAGFAQHRRAAHMVLKKHEARLLMSLYSPRNVQLMAAQ